MIHAFRYVPMLTRMYSPSTSCILVFVFSTRSCTIAMPCSDTFIVSFSFIHLAHCFLHGVIHHNILNIICAYQLFSHVWNDLPEGTCSFIMFSRLGSKVTYDCFRLCWMYPLLFLFCRLRLSSSMDLSWVSPCKNPCYKVCQCTGRRMFVVEIYLPLYTMHRYNFQTAKYLDKFMI